MYSDSRNRSVSPEGRGRPRRDESPPRRRYEGGGARDGARDSYRGGSSGGRRDRSPPKPSRVLGVFGLSYNTTEDQLRSVFTEFGAIERLVIVSDRETNHSRGFGFISFESIEIASAAKDKINGMELDGRTIRVDFSLSDKPRDGPPRDGGAPRGAPRYDDRNGGGYDSRPRGGDRYGGGGDRDRGDRDSYRGGRREY